MPCIGRQTARKKTASAVYISTGLYTAEFILWATLKISSTEIRSEERRVGKECRSRCEWSSDVCSSDLADGQEEDGQRGVYLDRPVHGRVYSLGHPENLVDRNQIGRASCRERV